MKARKLHARLNSALLYPTTLATLTILSLMSTTLFAQTEGDTSTTAPTTSSTSTSTATPTSSTSASTSSPAPAKTTNSREPLPGRAGLYALDFLLPGYGALRSGHPGRAATFFLARVGTAALAYEAYVTMVEYRSAERAARIAVLLRGPGLLFPDPYGNSFRTADEFQRLADRRAAIMSAAGTLHVFFTGLSLLLTHTFYEDAQDERAPVFSIGVAPAENGAGLMGRAGVGFRF